MVEEEDDDRVEAEEEDDDCVEAEEEESQSELMIDKFRLQLAELASSSLDVQSPLVRSVKIQAARDALADYPETRNVLAHEYKGTCVRARV
jgi:activator of HSP90 ATPase